jgi:hypothetical protein
MNLFTSNFKSVRISWVRCSRTLSDSFGVLPGEKYIKWTWPRVTLIYGLSLLLIFLANYSLFVLPTANRGYALVEHKWEMAKSIPHDTKVVFLGDSSGGSGLVPSSFEQSTGLPAVNLCTIGNMGTLGDVWMLQNLLASGKKPGVLLVMHTLDGWNREPAIDVLAQIPEPPGFWNRFSPPLNPTPTETIAMLSARYLPIYSQIVSFRQGVGYSFAKGKLLPDNRMSVVSADGFDPIAWSDPKGVMAEIEGEHLPALRSAPFRIPERNRLEISQLLEIAKKNGMAVIFAHGPIASPLAETQEFKEYFQIWQNQLQKIVQGYSSGQFFPQVYTFPPEQMQNTDHLEAKVAETFTSQLAGDLKNSGFLDAVLRKNNE